ncbi:MAG: 4-oxalocrotonate tautomerase [bacterium]|jgi:4-oxalocrotonate tautomerase
MPIVQIELLAGRTVDQKRSLVSKVTDAICDSLEVKPEAVSVILREMEHHDFAKAGKLWADK